MDSWVKNVIASDKRLAMPIITYPGLALTGNTVLEFVKSGKKQFECIRALAEKYDSIAAVTVMDLSAEAECFGSQVRFSENEIPTVIGKIVSDEESISALAVPKPGAFRTAEYLISTELAASAIADRPVFGGMIGPFSLAGRLFDITEIMMEMMLEPEMIKALVAKAAEFLQAYAQAFKDAGANGIIVAEPAAGLLSPEKSAEFSYEYLKKIIAAVQDDSFIFILHNCGNTKNQVKFMQSTGARGLHFGNAVDMTLILPQVRSDMLAFGNIDPVKVIKLGSPNDVRRSVRELLDKTAEYPNFVLSTGCDTPPASPLENIDAFFESVYDYNNR